MVSFSEIISMVIVAMFWGITNPLLRLGSKGVEKVSSEQFMMKIVQECIFLARNWKYTIPFLINQSASVLYFWTLANTELSVAVPVVNSLTFIFTVVAGVILKERLDRQTLFGSILITIGIVLCIFGKM